MHKDVPELIRDKLPHIGRAKNIIEKHQKEVVELLKQTHHGKSANEVDKMDLRTFEDFIVNIVYDQADDKLQVTYTFASTIRTENPASPTDNALREELLKTLRKEILKKGLEKWLDETLVEFDVIEE